MFAIWKVLLCGVAGAWILASSATAQPPAASTEAPATPTATAGILWPDGSLNFQTDLAISRGPILGIQEMLEKSPAPDGPPRDQGKSAILVFPFRDLTADGVGVFLTQGWHSIGTAALAEWSNANLLSPEAVWKKGAPAWDEMPPKGPESPSTWAKRIRSLEAVPKDAVIVSGVFQDGDTTATPKLAVFWLKPGEDTPQPLLSEAAGSSSSIEGLMEPQRHQARKLADAVIKAGLATENKGSGEAVGPEFDAELRRIVIAANARHSWLVQEAVNRALLLARRYPHEQAPLQAAAYAQTALRMSVYHYWYWGKDEEAHHTLAALAMSQLATELAPEAGGPRVLVSMNIWQSGIAYPSVPEAQAPGAWALLAALQPGRFRSYDSSSVKDYPGWVVGWLFIDNILQFRDTGLGSAIEELQSKREECDLIDGILESCTMAFEPLVQNSGWTYHESARNFLALNLGMLRKTDPKRAAALSAKLADLSPGFAWGNTEPTEFIRILKSSDKPLEAWISKAGEETGRWSAWDTPGSIEYKLLAVCADLRRNPPAGLDEPARSGFAGLEYTPAVRWRTYSARVDHGIAAYLEFLKERFGSEEMYDQIMGSIADSFTDPGSPLRGQRAKYLAEDAAKGHNFEIGREAMRTANSAMPTNWHLLLTLARLEFREGDPNAAIAMLTEAEHLARHQTTPLTTIAEIYCDVGCPRLALRCYARHLAIFPYDNIARVKYWDIRTKIGDKTPHLKVLEDAAAASPSDHDVVNALIRYQGYDLKDFKGAFANWQKYRATGSADAKLGIDLLLSGDKDTTLLFAGMAPPNTRSSLPQAAYYASVCGSFRKAGRLDEAQKMLEVAQKWEEWKGDVIEEAILLAADQEQWDKCLKIVKAGEGRYGPNANTRLSAARSLWALNQKSEAIKAIASYLKENPRDTAPVPKLIEYLIEKKRTAEAEQMMDWLLASPPLQADRLDAALKALEKANPERVVAIRKHRALYVGGAGESGASEGLVGRPQASSATGNADGVGVPTGPGKSRYGARSDAPPGTRCLRRSIRPYRRYGRGALPAGRLRTRGRPWPPSPSRLNPGGVPPSRSARPWGRTRKG